MQLLTILCLLHLIAFQQEMTYYKWVRWNGQVGTPPDALIGGHEEDGTPVYVGRARHLNDILPANIMPEKQMAIVPYGCEEHFKHEYEVNNEESGN